MVKRIGFWGLALACLSVACAEAPAGENEVESEGGEPVAESGAALQSCNAPIDAHADWLDATRDGEHWCTGCTFVNFEVRNAATDAPVLNYYAAIDSVSQRFVPGFCYGNFCFPSSWQRTGIYSDFYQGVSVSRGGDVTFNLGGQPIALTPDACVATTGSVTTITGTGSNGVRYTVRLSNTWFS